MYNNECKQRFLEASGYSETTRDSIRICFNTVSRVEKNEERDLAEFNQKQIINMLKSVDSKSRDYLQVMCSYFAKYYEWCYSEGLVESVVNEYTGAWISPIIENIIPIEFMVDKYYTKEDVLGYLDNANIYDVSNKLVTYALYCGIKLEELFNIKIEDLNVKDKTLKLISDRIIKVDDLLIDLIKRTNNASYYYPTESAISSDRGYYDYVIKSPYVIKRLKRKGTVEPLSLNAYQARLKIIKEQSGNKFVSVATLYKNGLINHIIEKHKETDKSLNIEKILFEKLNDKLYLHDDDTIKFINEFGSNMNPTQLRNELKDYMEYFK